jgi:putative endonuclease
MHFVYIVRCADGTLYTGYARDPAARERTHNSGSGARYTAGRRPVHLVYWESFKSVADALRRERQLKRLRRARKEALLNRWSYPAFASAASCVRRPSMGVIKRKF